MEKRLMIESNLKDNNESSHNIQDKNKLQNINNIGMTWQGLFDNTDNLFSTVSVSPKNKNQWKNVITKPIGSPTETRIHRWINSNNNINTNINKSPNNKEFDLNVHSNISTSNGYDSPTASTISSFSSPNSPLHSLSHFGVTTTEWNNSKWTKETTFKHLNTTETIPEEIEENNENLKIVQNKTIQDIEQEEEEEELKKITNLSISGLDYKITEDVIETEISDGSQEIHFPLTNYSNNNIDNQLLTNTNVISVPSNPSFTFKEFVPLKNKTILSNVPSEINQNLNENHTNETKFITNKDDKKGFFFNEDSYSISNDTNQSNIGQFPNDKYNINNPNDPLSIRLRSNTFSGFEYGSENYRNDPTFHSDTTIDLTKETNLSRTNNNNNNNYYLLSRPRSNSDMTNGILYNNSISSISNPSQYNIYNVQAQAAQAQANLQANMLMNMNLNCLTANTNPSNFNQITSITGINPMASFYRGTGDMNGNMSMPGVMLPPSSEIWYYEVEFKRFRRSVFVGRPHYIVGNHVKVEADRGQDLGHVVRVAQDIDNFRNSLSKTYGESNIEKKLSLPLKRILRLASELELSLLAQKFEEEKDVLDICRTKVCQRLLPMQVIDAEFQFDRHKLTFYFEADRRIDFRELVRDLFAMYKTRIWLQQVTTDGKIKKNES